MSKSAEKKSTRVSPAFKNEETQPAQQVNEIILTFKGCLSVFLVK